MKHGGIFVDEKKRAKLMKVFRVVALIVAIIMILGIFFQAFGY